MTSDPRDLRIEKILQLTTQLMDAVKIHDEAMLPSEMDNLDRIAAHLETIVEQSRARQTHLDTQLNDLASKVSAIAAQDFGHAVLEDEKDGPLDTMACAINILAEKFETLTNSQKYLLDIANSMLDSIVITDLTGHITMVNGAACGLFGYEEEELLKQQIDDLFSEPVRPESPDISDLEVNMIITKDGRNIPVSCSRSPLKGSQGQPEGLIFIAQDITERTHTEEELKAYQYSMDQAKDAIFWLTEDSGFAYVNEQACHSLGYTREELLALKLPDIDPNFQEEPWIKRWQRIREKPHSADDRIDSIHRRKDGSTFPVEISSKYMLFNGRELHMVTVRNITERQRAEKALRTSEARYRAVIESQIDLIGRYKPDTTLTFVNDAYCKFYGKTREELIGQSFLTMVNPQFHEQVRAETNDLVNNPRSISGTYLNYDANGEARWIQWVVQSIVDEQGQVSELQSVGRDITRQKQTQEALRESEMFLRKSQAVGLIGSYRYDIKSDAFTVSPIGHEIFGVPDASADNMQAWISLIHPDQQEEIREYLHQNTLEGHKRFNKEYRIIRQYDQQERWIHGIGELEFDEAGNAIGLIGTVQDITERKQMEEDLLLTQFCVDNASIGIMRIGNNAQIQTVNQEWCRTLGYTAEELCSLHVYDIDPNYPIDRWQTHYEYIHKYGPNSLETVHQHKDGTLIPVEITSTPVEFQGKEFAFSFIQDITAKKEMLEALRLKSFAVEQSSDAVYWIDKNALISDVNEAACRMTGYSREELLNMPVTLLNPEKTTDQIKRDWKTIQQGTPQTFETYHQTKDGRVFPVEIVVNHVAYEGKELNCTFVRDISERKQAEEDLKKSRSLLEENQAVLSATLESISDGLLVVAEDGSISHHNSSFTQMWDLPTNLASTSLDQSLIDHVLPQLAEPEKFSTRIAEIYQTDEAFEDVLRLKDGRLLERFSYPLTRQGQVKGRVWLFRDVTERKQAEEALRDSEYFLRRSQTIGQIGSYYLDIMTGTWTSSAMLDEIFGIDQQFPKNIAGWSQLMHPDDKDEMLDYLQKHVVLEHNRFDKEYRIVRHDNHEVHWVHGIGELEIDANGNAVKMFGTIQDITERKRAERALRESEFFLRKSQAIGQIGSYFFDIAADNWFGSPMLYTLYGIDEHFQRNVAGWASIIHPDYREKMLDHLLRHVLKEHNRFDEEFLIIRHNDKKERWIHGLGELEYDENNNPVRMFGTIQDITESKQANAKVLASEERLRQAARVGNIGIFDQDLVSGSIYWSPEQRQIWGCSIDGTITPQAFTESMHPEDLQRVQVESEKSYDPEGDGTLDIDHRIINHHGEVRWLKVRSQTLFEGKGSARRAVRTIGATADITELKRAQASLQASEERLRQAVSTGNIGIFDHDHINGTTYVSPEFRAMYGWEPDESITPRKILEKKLPAYRGWIQKERERIDNLADDGKYYAENQIINANGEIRWLSTHSQTFFEGIGSARRPIRTIGATADITEYKLADARVQASEERLRQAVTVGNIGVFDHDYASNTIYISPELRAIYGWKPDEIITVQDFIKQRHPSNRETIREKMHASNDPTGDGVYFLESQIITTDNQVRWVVTRARTFFEGEGDLRRAVRTIGATADITEHKLSEARLQASEERLRQAVRVGNIGIFDHDHITNTVYISPELRKIYGWDHDELITIDKFVEQVHPDDKQWTFEEIQRAHDPDGDGKYNVEARIIHHSGAIHWLSIRSRTFFEDQSGNRQAVRTIGAVADITERKEAEHRIYQLNENLERRVAERTKELEEANNEIKHFAYIVSHDLRAPLVNLKGFAAELRYSLNDLWDSYENVLSLLETDRQTVITQALQEDIPEALRFIESSVSSMDTFTKAILKLSRLGRSNLELVEIETTSLVERILESLAYQINQFHVKVTIGTLPVIIGDLVSMEQIFGNILSNAIAYLIPERPGEIEITAEASADEMTFFVRDNGRGIAIDDKDKIFAPFRRAGRQDVPGEGMGLAYVQTLIRRHGGRIWYESTIGEGTTFKFTISNNLTNNTDIT